MTSVIPFVRIEGKPHLRSQRPSVRRRLDRLALRSLDQLLYPRPTPVDLGPRARRRQRLKVKVATWAIPALILLAGWAWVAR